MELRSKRFPRLARFISGFSRSLVRGAIDTIQHDGIEHAGYLAFLGLLALFPFLVFVVAVIGAVGPETQLAQNFIRLFHTLPPEIILAIEPRITEITTGPPQGLITIAILGAIWTASSAVEGLRTILNRAYHVHTPPHYVFRRSLSILQLILFAFILIVGMLLMVTLPGLLQKVQLWLSLPGISPEARWWSHAIYFGSLGLLFSVVGWIYYALPNIRQRWISVWPGAMIVVLLWLGAARLFALYLDHFHQVALIYGSLGGIIVALVFFYVCNVIFIFGAEFNHHLSRHFGMRVVEREASGEPLEPG